MLSSIIACQMTYKNAFDDSYSYSYNPIIFDKSLKPSKDPKDQITAVIISVLLATTIIGNVIFWNMISYLF